MRLLLAVKLSMFKLNNCSDDELGVYADWLEDRNPILAQEIRESLKEIDLWNIEYRKYNDVGSVGVCFSGIGGGVGGWVVGGRVGGRVGGWVVGGRVGGRGVGPDPRGTRAPGDA